MRWIRLPLVLVLLLSAAGQGGAAESRITSFQGPRVEGFREVGSATPGALDRTQRAATEEYELLPPSDEREPSTGKTGPVMVYWSEAGTPLAAGVERLMDALRRAGFAARAVSLTQYGRLPLPQLPFAVNIVIGSVSELESVFREMDFGDLEAESFRIETLPGRGVIVAGGNQLGTTYACLALAEQVAAGRHPGSAEAKEQKPSLPIRGITVPSSIVRPANEAWLRSEDYWRALFSDMVATRWDSLFLPAALVAGDALGASGELIGRLAGEFDLGVIVDLEREPDGAGSPGLSSGLDDLQAFPGFQGVRFPVSSEEIRGGSVEAVHEVLERFPQVQIHVQVSADVAPSEVQAWLAGLGDARVFLWLPRGSDSVPWRDVGAGDAHLAGTGYECPTVPTRLTRWGDPSFVDSSLREPQIAGVTAVCLPADQWLLGPDRTGTLYQLEKCRNWTYLHEKHWFRLWLWGKCAYDGSVSREVAEVVFISRFGESVGPAMLHSRAAASRILTTLCDFFPELARPDVFLEGSWLGSVYPVPATAESPAISGRAVSARALSEMAVDPEESIGIPELVGMRMAELEVSDDQRTDPTEMAERLADLAHDCRESSRVSYQQQYSPRDIQESRSYDLELQFMANLGRYYAWQVWAAVEGLAARAMPGKERAGMAAEALEGVEREWGFVARMADLLYLPLQTGEGGAFHWKFLAEQLSEVNTWVATADEGIELRPVIWKVLGPIPLTTRHLTSLEAILSGTDTSRLATGLGLPQPELGWQELPVHLLAPTGTAPLPAWASRVNHFAGFVNLHRAYPGAVEGAGFAWHTITVEEPSFAVLECLSGEPEKVWLNGQEIFSRSQSESVFPDKGVAVELSAGENQLVFRSDLHRKGTVYWGAALRMRFERNPDEKPPSPKDEAKDSAAGRR